LIQRFCSTNAKESCHKPAPRIVKNVDRPGFGGIRMIGLAVFKGLIRARDKLSLAVGMRVVRAGSQTD